MLVVVGTGLIDALTERGLTPVTSADEGPEAVVQGFSPDVDWARLSEGAIAIRRGAFWLATNLDSTVPSARGPLPGNGSLVAALRHATGVTPIATGKPDPTMHAETVERTGARRPLVVGDRLDTDIEGAVGRMCEPARVQRCHDAPRTVGGTTQSATRLFGRRRQRIARIASCSGGRRRRVSVWTVVGSRRWEAAGAVSRRCRAGPGRGVC